MIDFAIEKINVLCKSFFNRGNILVSEVIIFVSKLLNKEIKELKNSINISKI